MSVITKNLNWEILNKSLDTFKWWNGLRMMKNFNFKNPIFRGGGGGGDGDTPMHTMSNLCQWWNFLLILCHVSIAALLMCNVCLRFYRWCFFRQKNGISRTYLLRKTRQRTNILMFFVWNKILKIWDTFWAHTNRIATQQKTI